MATASAAGSGLEPSRGLLWLRAVVSLALILICVHSPMVPRSFHILAAVLALHILSVVAAALWKPKSRWNQSFLGAQFLMDVACVTAALHLTENISSDLYIVYFFVILGTALTRNLYHSLIVGAVASLCYAYLGYRGAPDEIEPAFFYLRIPFLLLTSMVTGFTVHRFLKEEGDLEARYQERMMQMDKLAGAGQVMAAVLHEIKNPLSSIYLASEMILESNDLTADDRATSEVIHRQSEKTLEIAKDFLAFVSSDGAILASLDIRAPIRKALEALDPQLRKGGRDIRIRFDDKEVPPILGESDRLQQVFSNLFINAWQAMPQGGELSISVGLVNRKPWWIGNAKPQDIVEVKVQDSGMGISKERLNDIFEPFHSTKGADGTGLGLTVAQWILQKHKGAISVHSDGPGTGVLFTLEFPAQTLGQTSHSA